MAEIQPDDFWQGRKINQGLLIWVTVCLQLIIKKPFEVQTPREGLRIYSTGSNMDASIAPFIFRVKGILALIEKITQMGSYAVCRLC